MTATMIQDIPLTPIPMRTLYVATEILNDGSIGRRFPSGTPVFMTLGNLFVGPVPKASCRRTGMRFGGPRPLPIRKSPNTSFGILPITRVSYRVDTISGSASRPIPTMKCPSNSGTLRVKLEIIRLVAWSLRPSIFRRSRPWVASTCGGVAT